MDPVIPMLYLAMEPCLLLWIEYSSIEEFEGDIPGSLVNKWICQIVPSVFKFGTIIPIYKRKGKNPLNMASYRGITVTSVLSKTLEFVLLDRILPSHFDINIPYVTQTTY